MYATVWIQPSQRTWTADRLIDETGQSPITEQIVNHMQSKIITLMCARASDVATVIRALEDDREWHHNITNNCNPVQEGLDLFRGTITAQRYLKRDDPDNGSYTVGVTSF